MRLTGVCLGVLWASCVNDTNRMPVRTCVPQRGHANAVCERKVVILARRAQVSGRRHPHKSHLSRSLEGVWFRTYSYH